MKIVITERDKVIKNLKILHIFTDHFYQDDVVIQKFLDIKSQIKNTSYIFNSDNQFWATENFKINKHLIEVFSEFNESTFVKSNVFALNMLFLNYKFDLMISRKKKVET